MHKLFEYYSLPVIFKNNKEPAEKEIKDKTFQAILEISKETEKKYDSKDSRENL